MLSEATFYAEILNLDSYLFGETRLCKNGLVDLGEDERREEKASGKRNPGEARALREAEPGRGPGGEKSKTN